MKRFSSTKVKLLVLLSIIVHVIGVLVFLLGFFPDSRVLKGFSTENDLPKTFGNYSRPNTGRSDTKAPVNLRNLYGQRFDKVVLILIDSLRADFIPSVRIGLYDEPTMPFVENLLKTSHACAVTSWASNPTVTLPRIKAMMSGAVPGFLDIARNLQASSINEDNILSQAHAANKRIVFYGDDTWQKLFTGTFERSEGTVSFFVTDYKEVDYNVTRNVKKEIEKSDWDILILHYLGLDHIGHVTGPKSPLIEPKLKEMDDVVKDIFSQLSKNPKPSLIVIFGDHGMTNSGNHGGVSEAELLVPIIFISTDNGPLLEKPTTIYNRKFLQIDIASTLAVLMGLPIPKNNIGSPISSAMSLAKMTPKEQLYALYYNALQVLDLAKGTILYDHYNPKIGNIISLHRIWTEKASNDISMYRSIKSGYIELMAAVTNNLESVNTKYDLYTMVIGCLTTTSALFMALTITFDRDNLGQFMGFIDVALGLFGLGVSLALHCAVCIAADSHMCNSFLWIAPATVITFFFYMLLQFLKIVFLGLERDLFFSLSIGNFIAFACVLHGFSLGSSSFVEEEHQTWYFFTMTLMLLLFLRSIKEIVQSFDISSELVSTKHTFVGNSFAYSRVLRIKFFTCCSLLIVTRLLRTWNQTGNKWASIPDMADWLIQDQHKSFLLLFCILSLLILGYLQTTKRSSQIICLWSSIIIIFLYHCENSNLPFSIPFEISKVTLPRLGYFLILIGVIETFIHPVIRSTKSFSRKCVYIMKSITCNWLLLFILLSRTQNIPLISLIVVQEYLAHELVWNQPMPLAIRSITYFWLGMCAFFYQGNSNMLSTLDVASGYVGLSEYHPLIVGILMVCHTYGGLIFWLLRYVSCLCQLVTKEEISSNSLNQVYHTIASILTLRFFVITVYFVTVIFLRYHLFIWSVFAPKLLYETAHSALISVFALTLLFFINLVSRKNKNETNS